MENYNFNEIFLARWIAGELTEEELKAFKETKEYQYYQKIDEGSQKFNVPAYDNKTAFSKLLDTLDQEENKQKVVRLIPKWAFKVAAVLVVALGLIMIFTTSNTSNFSTGFGEQTIVTLPDNSLIRLNANSKVDFKKKNWDTNRLITLKGQAFFDVEKGSSFVVKTQEGEVEVLGTQFNIISRNNYFEVTCFEGSVNVIYKNKTLGILKLGEGLRVVNGKAENWNFVSKEPAWIKGESSFENTPLIQVIRSLENQYNLKFNVDAINAEKRFTGSFTHSNLPLALKTVFDPLDISYSTENSIVVLKYKN